VTAAFVAASAVAVDGGVTMATPLLASA